VPAQSSFDVGQENLFTIFEMAPGEGGIPSAMGMSESAVGMDEYNFTDDFDAGGAEYGVDENVLDLSDAEAEGFGIGPVSEPRGVDNFEFDTSGMDDMPSTDAGSDDFELNLGEDLQDNEMVATDALEADRVGGSSELDFSGGFDEDEVEGLGFGFDDSPADSASEDTTEEISLEADSEPEISLEPELELAGEEPSLELSDEPELDIADEQPSLELDEDPSLELSEDPSMDFSEEIAADDIEDTDDTGEFNVVDEGSMELPDDLDLAEEPELMEPAEDEYGEMADDGGIEFDLDSVDLDTPEEITYEGESEAEAVNEATEEEPFMDLEGLEMENSDDPEDEELKQ
jgi:hypothetical protein